MRLSQIQWKRTELVGPPSPRLWWFTPQVVVKSMWYVLVSLDKDSQLFSWIFITLPFSLCLTCYRLWLTLPTEAMSLEKLALREVAFGSTVVWIFIYSKLQHVEEQRHVFWWPFCLCLSFSVAVNGLCLSMCLLQLGMWWSSLKFDQFWISNNIWSLTASEFGVGLCYHLLRCWWWQTCQ